MNLDEDYLPLFEDCLNEKIHWDTVLTKPFDLNKEITLYHYTDKKLDKLIPIGVNAGNKLSRTPRRSIWFTEWDDSWTLPIFAYLKFNYRPEFNEDEIGWGYDNFDDDKKLNNDGTLKTGIKITREFYEKHKSEIDNFKVYRYEKKFKIKDLGRGTEPSVPEWTYDKEVIPDNYIVKTGKDLIKNKTIIITTKEDVRKGKDRQEEVRKSLPKNNNWVTPYMINYKPEWWKYNIKKYNIIRKKAEEKMGVKSYKELHKK